MTRVHINSDEWYPVYDIFEADDGKYEVEPETLARWRSARDTHKLVLAEIEAMIEKEVRGGFGND